MLKCIVQLLKASGWSGHQPLASIGEVLAATASASATIRNSIEAANAHEQHRKRLPVSMAALFGKSRSDSDQQLCRLVFTAWMLKSASQRRARE